MLTIISPAKSLNYEATLPENAPTQPQFLQQTKALVGVLKKQSRADLRQMMHISEKLADLNYQRYQGFSFPFTAENARPALSVFDGDVYGPIETEQYSTQDYAFAQAHLRILSGLYGLLRPLDLMQPYRLEMGTKLATEKGERLYDFWADTLTKALNSELAEQKSKVLVNLASNEYASAVQLKDIEGQVITPVFKENKDGKPRVIALFAKKARGMMVNYMMRNQIDAAEALKDFTEGGYAYEPSLSSADEWVFLR